MEWHRCWVSLALAVLCMWMANRMRTRRKVGVAQSGGNSMSMSYEMLPSEGEDAPRHQQARDVSFENLGLRLYSTGGIVLEGVTGVYAVVKRRL